MQESPGSSALRKGRVSLPEQVYLLTTVVAGRRPVFANPVCARAACRTLAASENWPCAHLLCWILMPDHWHGLVQLDEGATLARTMGRWKAAVSRELHRDGHRERIWQRGFHDHALRRDEGVKQAARYIVANPVRAGLVKSVRQYPYWNSIWLE